MFFNYKKSKYFESMTLDFVCREKNSWLFYDKIKLLLQSVKFETFVPRDTIRTELLQPNKWFLCNFPVRVETYELKYVVPFKFVTNGTFVYSLSTHDSL